MKSESQLAFTIYNYNTDIEITNADTNKTSENYYDVVIDPSQSLKESKTQQQPSTSTSISYIYIHFYQKMKDFRQYTN